MNDHSFHTKLDQGKEELKKRLVMTAEEKSALFERIVAGAEAGVARKAKAVRSPWTLYSFRLLVERNRLAAAATVVVLALALSGGNVALAAKGSVPGDLLYPVKTNVIEPVEGALAVTPTAQAQFDAAVASTRLDEAETLAAQGQLDPAAQAEIQTSFNAHVSALSAALDKVAQTNATSSEKMRSSFEASMERHAQALGAIATRGQAAPAFHAGAPSASSSPEFSAAASSSASASTSPAGVPKAGSDLGLVQDVLAARDAIGRGDDSGRHFGTAGSVPAATRPSAAASSTPSLQASTSAERGKGPFRGGAGQTASTTPQRTPFGREPSIAPRGPQASSTPQSSSTSTPQFPFGKPGGTASQENGQGNAQGNGQGGQGDEGGAGSRGRGILFP